MQASLSTSNMRGNVRETGNVFTRYVNSVWSKEILILIYSDRLCEIYFLMFLNYLEESFVVVLDSVSGFRIPDFTAGSRSFPVLLGGSVNEAAHAHNTSKWRLQLKGSAEETISTL